MPREFAIGGMLLPGLLVLFVGLLVLMALLDGLAGRLGWYRHVWHPPLFRAAVFVLLLGCFGLLLF